MKQFTAEEALRIFREHKRSGTLRQNSDGAIIAFSEENRCMGIFGICAEHPDGWQNSLYSREQFICNKCKGYKILDNCIGYYDENREQNNTCHGCPNLSNCVTGNDCPNCQDENGVPTGLALPEEGK